MLKKVIKLFIFIIFLVTIFFIFEKNSPQTVNKIKEEKIYPNKGKAILYSSESTAYIIGGKDEISNIKGFYDIKFSSDEKDLFNKIITPLKEELFNRLVVTWGSNTKQYINEYYSPEFFHYYYYDDKRILLSTPDGSGYKLYDTENKKIIDSYTSKNESYINSNYLIFSITSEVLSYYKFGSPSFVKIEKPFTIDESETFYKGCDYTGGICNQDINIAGNILYLGIYNTSSKEKIREIKILLD